MAGLITANQSLIRGLWHLALGFVLCTAAVRGEQLGRCRWNQVGPLAPQRADQCLPIVDERSASDQVNRSPWSSPITCLRPRSKEDSVYCLFTSPSFKDNHGLSIITTPEAAADIASGVGVRPAYSPWDSLESLPSPGPVSDSAEAVYEVADIKGKGKGVIAKKLIRKDEVFMLDYPALMVAGDFAHAVHFRLQIQLVRRAVDNLPEATRDAFRALAGGTGEFEATDILKTNAYTAPWAKNESYMVVFPEMSVSEILEAFCAVDEKLGETDRRIETENKPCMQTKVSMTWPSAS